ncbi:MAG TPA: T9SS type A sorting domain-containing protein, partial [Saprospiraceae bacterium]|nr:T9SS type A sorting domain-containing protein [Saprospiraceae bacterium]
AEVSGGTKPYTYLWSTGENQSEITGLAPGSYKVWIDDFNGCKAQSEFEVLQVTGVQEAGKATSFFIFPNPATQQLWLRTFENHQASAWKVYNAQGRLADSGKLDTGGSLFQIGLNGWLPGMYWFELEFEGGNRSGQILIKQ